MSKRRFGIASLALAAFLIVFILASASYAKPVEGDHDGDADSNSEVVFTEDNDTNDPFGDDIEDPGDNAHPSGKDRSVENSNEAKNPNQGKAESDPDDNGKGPDRTNRGPDKPNGTGGDQLEDQDGNNGCGNDDDFEDDNEGRCGRRPSTPPTTPPGNPPTDVGGTGGENTPGTQVLGSGQEAQAQVLGVKLVAGERLPSTGIDATPMLFTAMVLLTIGLVMTRLARTRVES